LTPAGRGTENRCVRGSCLRFVAVLAAALALAALAPTRQVAAQSSQLDARLYRRAAESLAAGKLLVAARRLPDSNFARTVVLLVDFTRKGALGVIVNRRSEIPLGRAFPHLTPTIATAAYAFLGGPVERTQMLALVHGAETSPDARHVVDGVYLASSRAALEALMAAGTASNRLRVYLGYAGWGAGQLEAETSEGAWHVFDGRSAVVVDADPATIWHRQIALTEVIQARR